MKNTRKKINTMKGTIVNTRGGGGSIHLELHQGEK
jgi:hypothetical protein